MGPVEKDMLYPPVPQGGDKISDTSTISPPSPSSRVIGTSAEQGLGDSGVGDKEA